LAAPDPVFTLIEMANLWAHRTYHAAEAPGTPKELRGFAPIGMLEYWNYGILGSKRHSAEGRE